MTAKNKIIFMVFFILVFGSFLLSSETLNDWGSWLQIDKFSKCRVRCSHFNKSANKFVWEVQVHNGSNRTLGITIKVIDEEDRDNPPNENWQRNSKIEAGESYVFPLQFCKSGPGKRVSIIWKNVVYK